METISIYNEIKEKYPNISFAELHMIAVVDYDIQGSDLNFNDVYELCHRVWTKDDSGISIQLIVDYITDYYEEIIEEDYDPYTILDNISRL